MFRWVFTTAEELFTLWREVFEDLFRWEEPQIQLQNQLRAMYGRGELTRERFIELRVRLHRNQIGLGDIQLVQREVEVRRRADQGFDEGSVDRQIERSLNRLYIDLGLVEEARVGILQSQQAIAKESRWLGEQAAAARESAQAALPDEQQAREHLEMWHRLVGASRQIELRSQAISEELQRLDELQAEIKASVIRLQMLLSEEKLARLRLHLRQDLSAQTQVVIGQKR